MRYNNYHKHTHYSNVMTPDSIIKPEDIAKRAIELGHTSLCTTEHGYAGNVYEYYDLAQKYNLKFVFGVEYYYVENRFENDRSNTHLMIMAKNEDGMKEMKKIMSEASQTGYYYKPRIDKKLVLSLNPENVVVTSTCVISYVGKHDDYEDNFILPLLNHFKDNFYLEIHDNTHPMQVEYNKKILDLHNIYRIPLIHATDTHYIHPEDDKDRTEFLNGKNIYYPEEDGFILDYPDSNTIFERYRQQGVFTKKQVEESLKNTLIIDNFEDIVLDKKSIKMPSIHPNLSHEEKVKKLKQTLTNEWKKDRKYINLTRSKEYIEAIQFETDIVEGTSMEDYFLLNYEIIKRAKEKGGVLSKTGRGSAPSMYINKLLGFTEIDRLDAPITLYPTRFMSKSRILETGSLPDIDFNTANPEPFIEASKEILGNDNVYYMIAYGKMKESEAFRNYCRAKEIDYDTTNEIAKDLDSYRNHPDWKHIIKESEKFLNVIDSASPHPCAFLLLDKPISEEVGLITLKSENSKKETVCVLIDSSTSDEWNYLKNDFLTVTVWQIISEGFKAINKPIPDIRELTSLIENDEKVWNLYEKGLTATLNQAGTISGTPQVMQYKPKNIRELSAWVSAIRPQFASMKHYFLNREGFSYGIPEFDAILKESDNFILYQENIMATLVYSGFPEDQTYGLLKAIAKKKEGIIEPIHDKFVEGFVSKTGSEDDAEKVWQIIQDSVKYGFNSSHAYSVALDSLYGAYLKANYPLEYYSVVLNKYEKDTDMTNNIYQELSHFNIKIVPIKFRKSRAKYSPDKTNNQIVKGIQSIKYLNSNIAEELFELGKKHYNNFVNLLVDIAEKTTVNARQLNILIRLGFFEEFGHMNKLLNIVEEFNGGKNRYDKKHKDTTKDKRLPLLVEYERNLEIEHKVDMYEQILFEKEHYGYATTVYPKISNTYALVLDINKKYTPRITLYQLKTGEEFVIKVKKNKFFNKNDDDLLYIGDIIKITKTSQQPKWKLDDGKWVQDHSVKELYLDSCELVKRREEILSEKSRRADVR